MATIVQLDHTRGVEAAYTIPLTTEDDVESVKFRIYPRQAKQVTALEINSDDHAAAVAIDGDEVVVTLDLASVAASSTFFLVANGEWGKRQGAYLLNYEVIVTTDEGTYTEQLGILGLAPGTLAPVVSSVGVDYSIPTGALVVDSGASGDYSTLSAALAAIDDNDSDNRRTVAVRGTVTETALVTAKNFVDVIFMDGSILKCNSVGASVKGILFANITDAIWKAFGSAEIQRNEGTGGNCWVIEATNGLAAGRVLLENLIIRNQVHTSIRNYGVSGTYLDLVGCKIYGAGTDRAYGGLFNARVNALDCDFFGGDNTIGGAGGSLPVGLVTSSGGHTGVIERCRAYGGNAGTGTEAYGIWAFAYSLASRLIDCKGYGGIASNFTDGINCHKSATAELVRCVGEGGVNGHGIAVYGNASNYASHVLIDCEGFCKATSGDWHGLSWGDGVRDQIIGGAFYGSPLLAGSCGVRLDANFAPAVSDNNAVGRAYGARFFGGGAGKEGQASPTQNAGCSGLRLGTALAPVFWEDCHFLGNSASVGIEVGSGVTPETQRFDGGSAESMDAASHVAISSTPTWADAQIYRMFLPGGLGAGITPSAGTAEGTNIVPSVSGLRGMSRAGKVALPDDYDMPVVGRSSEI